jgi:hypothetical protein
MSGKIAHDPDVFVKVPGDCGFKARASLVEICVDYG